MREHALDLMAADAPGGEVIRQLAEREESDLAGFQPRAWCSPLDVANEEQLINMERVQRQMAMPIPVV